MSVNHSTQNSSSKRANKLTESGQYKTKLQQASKEMNAYDNHPIEETDSRSQIEKGQEP